MAFSTSWKSSRVRIRRASSASLLSVAQSYQKLGTTFLGDNYLIPTTSLSESSYEEVSRQVEPKASKKTLTSLKKRLLRRPKWMWSGSESHFSDLADSQVDMPLLSGTDFVDELSSSEQGSSERTKSAEIIGCETKFHHHTLPSDFRWPAEFKELLSARSFFRLMVFKKTNRVFPASFATTKRKKFRRKKSKSASSTSTQVPNQDSDGRKFSLLKFLKKIFGGIGKAIYEIWLFLKNSPLRSRRFSKNSPLRLRRFVKSLFSKTCENDEYLADSVSAHDLDRSIDAPPLHITSKDGSFSIPVEFDMDAENDAEITSSSFTTPKFIAYEDEQHSDSEVTRQNSVDLQTFSDIEDGNAGDTEDPDSSLKADSQNFAQFGVGFNNSAPLTPSTKSATDDILASDQEQNSFISVDKMATMTFLKKFAANALLVPTGPKVDSETIATHVSGQDFCVSPPASGSAEIEERISITEDSVLAEISESRPDAQSIGLPSSDTGNNSGFDAPKDFLPNESTLIQALETNRASFEVPFSVDTDDSHQIETLDIPSSPNSPSLVSENNTENEFVSGNCASAAEDVSKTLKSEAPVLAVLKSQAPICPDHEAKIKVEEVAQIREPDNVTSDTSNFASQGYNPCTKTTKAWADYDSDFGSDSDTDSGESVGVKLSETNQQCDSKLEGDFEKIHSAFEFDVQPPIEPLSIDFQLKGLHYFSSLPEIAYETNSIGNIFASNVGRIPESQSISGELGLLPVDNLTLDDTYDDELSAAIQAIERAPKDPKIVAMESLLTGKKPSPHSQESETIYESKEIEDVVEKCRSDIFSNHSSWMQTELLLLDFENDEEDTTIKGRLKRVSFVEIEESHSSEKESELESEEGIKNENTEEKESDEKEEAADEEGEAGEDDGESESDEDEENTESPWWESKFAVPEPKDSESLSNLDALLAQIEQRNADDVVQSLKAAITDYRNSFLCSIKNDVRPCNDKIKTLLKEVLAVRRSVWELFSRGSALKTEISNALDSFEDQFDFEHSHRTKLELFASTISDIEFQSKEVETSIQILEQGFDVRFKNITGIIAEMNSKRDSTLGKYDEFCETNESLVIFDSFNIHSCTHVEDYEKGTTWYCYLDLEEFEEFLTDDIHSLVACQKPLETVIRSVRGDYESLEKKWTS